VLGLNNYVIVIVVNAIFDSNKKPTDFFKATTAMVAATNSVQQATGNVHNRSNIQKQAYIYSEVPNVRAAYGLTGTNFDTHSPFINGKEVSKDATLARNVEIILINNDIQLNLALDAANVHKIIPSRTSSVIPSRLN
jgi:hypothetical protein